MTVALAVLGRGMDPRSIQEPPKPWFVTVTIITSWGFMDSSSKSPIVHPSHHPHMVLLHSCGHRLGATTWKLILKPGNAHFQVDAYFQTEA